MRRALQLLGTYTHLAYLQWLGSRSFTFTLVVNQSVTPLLGLAVWSAALPGRSQVPAYYVALLLVQLLTVSYENHILSNRIYLGEFVDDLLLPHPVIFPTLGQNVAIRIWHVLVGLPLILAVALFTSAHLKPSAVLLALPACLLAAILRFLFTYLLSLTAFWTERAHAVVGFGGTMIFLLGGGAAPVPLLPGPLRVWGEALPFRAMQGFPAEVASSWSTGGQVATGLAWQVAWCCAFLGAATVAWQHGLRRYTAVGG